MSLDPVEPRREVGRLSQLNRLQDVSLLAGRLVIGAFLIWGVADNVTSQARMAEFAAFLSTHGFYPAAFWAPVSVYAQLLCGLSLISGIAVRAAGLLLMINFLVAIVMVDGQAGIRSAFPSMALVLAGFHWVAFGAGRFTLPVLWRRVKA